jgi:pyruvate ferredoxin oxidoreductase gamma subunit
MLEVRWHGRGGQGGFTAARLLGLAAALYEGKYALAFPSFGPERRGAPVLGFTRIDDKKITDRSAVTECDYVVVLDETLMNAAVVAGLKPTGKLVVNSTRPEQYRELAGTREIIAVDATALAMEILGRPITNTAMLGALVAASGIIRVESALEGITHEMSPALARKNSEVLRRAYAQVVGVNA